MILTYKILFNGKIITDRITISAGNEALNYGKGLFETIRYEKGKLFFYNEHIKRLEEACYALGIDFDLRTLAPDHILRLINKNKAAEKTLRVKILYTPLSGDWDTCASGTINARKIP